MACVTACPSGVPYAHLLGPFRERAEVRRIRPPLAAATRRLVKETLPYPGRFRLAAAAGGLGKLAAGILPAELAGMVNLLPASLPPAQPLPDFFPAVGRRRGRVALLAGCVQQARAPQINWATLRVLARNGVETVIPAGQGCCGSLSLHIGAGEQARGLARANLHVFPADVDAIITNAAGCGSGMHEYPLLFAGEADCGQAAEFAARVMDISVYLDKLGLEPPAGLPEPLAVAYHDACHLAHAQGVTAEPRRLLAAVPNLKLVEIAESELCCGSAGTYNLEQPELAQRIGERKARNILATGAQAIVTGNIGCLTQIRTHLELLGRPLPIWHTVELLDAAYRG
jgi:glycolate oxidase iron-sulfur subunit